MICTTSWRYIGSRRSRCGGNVWRGGPTGFEVVRDSCGGDLDRVPPKVLVALGGLRLRLTEQFPDHERAFSEGGARAANLQEVEGIPLTAKAIEMFEREGWPPERRRAHILRRVGDRGRIAAAAKE